ncbi:MAG: hypothetical protein U5J82_15550 [Desulfobacterales bacterium]|nr:hypothetical protein [Desulfobacterales bacterium]
MIGTTHAGDLADALDAAENDQGGEDHQHDTRDPERHLEGGVDGVGHRVGLDHVADPEGRHGGEKGKDKPQPLPAQPLRDVVHGAAAHVAFFVLDPVLHGQNRFPIFGGHADQAGDPHPEQGSRSTGGNGRCYAGNVAGPDGGRQGGHQGLKMRDVARLVGIFLPLHQRQPKGVPQFSELQAPQDDGQIESGTDEKYQHGRTPGKCPDLADQVFYGTHYTVHVLPPR